MKYGFFIAALTTAALLVADAGAAPPVPETLTPSSKWTVNYADDSCRLARAFGTGDALTIAMFDRFAPGPSFKLMLAGKRFRNIGGGAPANLRFGTEGEQKRDFFTGDFSKDLPALIVRGDLRFDARPERARKAASDTPNDDAPMAPARLAAVDSLVVGRPLGKPIRLALGSITAPVAALDKCIDDLLGRWGVDPVRHATLSRRVVPTSNPANWLDSSDYPELARFRGQQGIVNFRLSIDETGKPTACHIQLSTRPVEFDTAVCSAMMRRARFAPALDKDGKPLASYFRSTVVFAMG